MVDRKHRPPSPPKAWSRRVAHRHAKTIMVRCKDLIMGILHVVNRPMTPMEIWAVAKGTTDTWLQPLSFSSVCTQLEQQGHIISIPDHGVGPSGYFPAARLILSDEHVNGPIPELYRKVHAPAPYPVSGKLAVKERLKIGFSTPDAERLTQAYARRVERALVAMLKRSGN